MAKKVEANVVKCANCGGDLIFSPKDQSLLCENCNSTKPFEKTQTYYKHPIAESQSSLDSYKAWVNENKIIKCKTCGSEILLHSLEYSQKCPYCGSSYVAEIKSLSGISPDAIIPFAFDEEVASVKFKEGVKKKFFVPRAFKKTLPWNKILGIYTPSFTFEATTRSAYNGILVETYSDSEGNRRSRSFSISGTKNINLVDIIVETSTKLDQDQMNAILPYDRAGVYGFNENFIRGYVVEHYDKVLAQSHNDARSMMRERIKQEILNGYKYTYVQSLNINTTFSNEYFVYRLNPVYKFEYQYKGKPYNTFMNGQTGKVGKGLPISVWKVGLVIFFVVAIITAIVVLSVLYGNVES